RLTLLQHGWRMLNDLGRFDESALLAGTGGQPGCCREKDEKSAAGSHVNASMISALQTGMSSAVRARVWWFRMRSAATKWSVRRGLNWVPRQRMISLMAASSESPARYGRDEV